MYVVEGEVKSEAEGFDKCTFFSAYFHLLSTKMLELFIVLGPTLFFRAIFLGILPTTAVFFFFFATITPQFWSFTDWIYDAR